MTKTTYDAFVSYRWTEPEKTWVREEFVPRLRAAGLSICLDIDDFIPGRDLILEMERAGIQSKHILCVITPSYFDGNRMVSFESLAARRRDPSGQSSTLIPILLKHTELPEWIRGLIPIDWTDKNRIDKEWAKLLQILGGDERVSSPSSLHEDKSTKAHRIKMPNKLDAIDIIPLSLRTGEGFGWDIVLANISNETIIIDTAIISGEYATIVRGFMAAMNRTEFEIVLEAKAIAEPAKLDIHGSIFESGSSEWGRKCSGQLQHEFSTKMGRDIWIYSLTLPLYTTIPPSQRHILRLAFKPNSKIITKTEVNGETPMYTRLGLLKSAHTIDLSNGSHKLLTLKVDTDFLEFISKIKSSAQ
jgi:hypothetical protein